ncbi:MAG: TlpA family protein disulfide reductase [Devosiaceae bacterium]|nr:TlpA family protein disulfide reductase [Devosiaceae bacterium MH13]
MSDPHAQQPDEKPQAPQPAGQRRDRGKLSLGVLIGLAAVLGVVAGVTAVYVNTGVQDNVETAACALSEERHQAMLDAAQGEVAAFAVLDEPREAPDLAFNDGDGQPRTLAEWEGRAVLLNLWATWCAPCREEMPMLDNLQAEHGGEDFEVVAISIDTRESANPRGFLEEIAVDDLAFFHDPTAGVFNVLRREGLAFGMPTTLIIDEAGCLQGWLAGPAHWDHPDAVALIEAARRS